VTTGAKALGALTEKIVDSELLDIHRLKEKLQHVKESGSREGSRTTSAIAHSRTPSPRKRAASAADAAEKKHAKEEARKREEKEHKERESKEMKLASHGSSAAISSGLHSLLDSFRGRKRRAHSEAPPASAAAAAAAEAKGADVGNGTDSDRGTSRQRAAPADDEDGGQRASPSLAPDGEEKSTRGRAETPASHARAKSTPAPPLPPPPLPPAAPAPAPILHSYMYDPSDLMRAPRPVPFPVSSRHAHAAGLYTQPLYKGEEMDSKEYKRAPARMQALPP
jgi:hypothetical protein